MDLDDVDIDFLTNDEILSLYNEALESSDDLLSGFYWDNYWYSNGTLIYCKCANYTYMSAYCYGGITIYSYNCK